MPLRQQPLHAPLAAAISAQAVPLLPVALPLPHAAQPQPLRAATAVHPSLPARLPRLHALPLPRHRAPQVPQPHAAA